MPDRSWTLSVSKLLNCSGRLSESRSESVGRFWSSITPRLHLPPVGSGIHPKGSCPWLGFIYQWVLRVNPDPECMNESGLWGRLSIPHQPQNYYSIKPESHFTADFKLLSMCGGLGSANKENIWAFWLNNEWFQPLINQRLSLS